jgi:hypothetical protein
MRLIPALAAGLLLVPAAPAADALIRPGKGIGKLELRMTERQVRAAMGAPQAVVRKRVGFGRVSLELQFQDAHWTVRLVGRPGALRVVAVTTMVRSERTREGFGVGTREQTLRRRYGRARRSVRPATSPGSRNGFARRG